MNIRVVKFGGTSVQDAGRIRKVYSLVQDRQKVIVVLSAMAGVTNQLEEVITSIESGETERASEILIAVESRFTHEATLLLSRDIEALHRVYKQINALFSETGQYIVNGCKSGNDKAALLGLGERFNSLLFAEYASMERNEVFRLSSPDFIVLSQGGDPDIEDIHRRLFPVIDSLPEQALVIMEGFICSDSDGNPATLGRGGSDYTAALIGAALCASEIRIWTDIDGLHQNDPRYVNNTRPVHHLSYNEAAELAYFGAKILHPKTAWPARQMQIPIRILNTMQPEAEGTLITDQSEERRIKAVAAKSGITRIKIESGRMLQAHGFLRKLFQVFDEFETPIDMVTTSEVSVSLSIDNSQRLPEIEKSLRNLGMVEVKQNQAIVCVVGDFLIDHYGRALEVFQCLRDIPISMISYGSSNSSISFMVDEKDKERVLNQLQQGLFTQQPIQTPILEN